MIGQKDIHNKTPANYKKDFSKRKDFSDFSKLNQTQTQYKNFKI